MILKIKTKEKEFKSIFYKFILILGSFSFHSQYFQIAHSGGEFLTIQWNKEQKTRIIIEN